MKVPSFLLGFVAISMLLLPMAAAGGPDQGEPCLAAELVVNGTNPLGDIECTGSVQCPPGSAADCTWDITIEISGVGLVNGVAIGNHHSGECKDVLSCSETGLISLLPGAVFNYSCMLLDLTVAANVEVVCELVRTA